MSLLEKGHTILGGGGGGGGVCFFLFSFANFHFFYRQHIHHITCTEQDKHIMRVNNSYCYLCAQHITTFFLKSIVIVVTTLFPPNHYLFINISINLKNMFTMIRMIKLLHIVYIICFC